MLSRARLELPPADHERAELLLPQVHRLSSEARTQLLVREADARATPSPLASANWKGATPARCGR